MLDSYYIQLRTMADHWQTHLLVKEKISPQKIEMTGTQRGLSALRRNRYKPQCCGVFGWPCKAQIDGPGHTPLKLQFPPVSMSSVLTEVWMLTYTPSALSTSHPQLHATALTCMTQSALTSYPGLDSLNTAKSRINQQHKSTSMKCVRSV